MTQGRPPLYNTPEELQAKIDDYFQNGMKIREVVVGKGENQKVHQIPVPTITGLVLHLGFCDRRSFYDYEERTEFSHTIKKARTRIEMEYEEALATTGNAGAIFALKNFGWTDKQEHEHSGKGGGPIEQKWTVEFVNAEENRSPAGEK